MAGNVVFRTTAARSIAAQARALGATQEDAAGHASCSVRTLQRWEHGDADYWRVYEDARRDLKRLAWGQAWSILRRALRSDDPAERLRAASKIIDSVDRGSPVKPDHASDAAGGPIEIVVIPPAELSEADDVDELYTEHK